LSDYQKGRWVKERPKLRAEIQAVAAQTYTPTTNI
jgi:hypothetical protein